MDLDFRNIKSAHFIGIGGIGISAIARMMIGGGKEVTGSDRARSLITDELEGFGAKVFVGHSAKNIPKNCDLVVYTVAVPSDNPELAEARKRKIKTLSYPEVLGLISKDKFTIAISGTHGKTTTTAMAGKVMVDAGLDPTVIVGSLIKDSGSNLVVGKSKYFVVEACEYRRSFLNIQPKIIIITNIDNDHLDYYKDIKDIQKAFSEFVAKLGPEDYLITDAGNKTILPVVKKAKCKIIDYSLLGSLAPKLRWKMIGRHNLENAKAVLALASVLKISPSTALGALNKFSGTWRRFEFKGKAKGGALVYDDYGHHPTEIKATLRGAREHFGDKKKIVAIFQPHLYSRTKLLLKEFAESFADVDELILLPIYAAREVEDKTISSEILAKKISEAKTTFMATFPNDREQTKVGFGEAHFRSVSVAHNMNEAVALVPKSADIIITMGAGDVTDVAGKLVNLPN